MMIMKKLFLFCVIFLFCGFSLYAADGWITSAAKDSATTNPSWKLNFIQGSEADIWDEMWIWTPDKGVEFTFTGTQVRIKGYPNDSTDSEHLPDGSANTVQLYIDNVLVKDHYKGWLTNTAGSAGNQLIWTSDVLAEGTHTVKLVLNDKITALKTEIGINSFEYVAPVVTPTPELVLYASAEGVDWGETVDKLVDGDLNTKWGAPGAMPVWVVFKYKTSKTWNKYSLTSGNDDPTRDFKDWTLQCSNDSITWVTLDTQTGHAPWDARNSTLDFVFSNTVAFTYYRFNITSNNGNGGYTQLSEITFSNGTVVETAPDAATGLLATALSATEIELKWDVTPKAIGYTVWSKAGAAGTWNQYPDIASGDITTFNATDLTSATEYFFKVVAWNNIGDAPESVEVSATTQVVTTPDLALYASSEGFDWNETVDKLVDGDLNTKWGTPGAMPVWVVFKYNTAKAWNKYSLTSGNDAPTRDFKDWTLEGSNDSLTWLVLDTQTGHAQWDARNSTLDFVFSNTVAYTYYRFNITANNGFNGYTQLSEIQFSYSPSTGIANIVSKDFSIYPNPATNGSFKITTTAAFTTGIITITDLSGKTVLTTTIDRNTSAVNIMKLPGGFYNVTLSTMNKNLSQKLIVK